MCAMDRTSDDRKLVNPMVTLYGKKTRNRRLEDHPESGLAYHRRQAFSVGKGALARSTIAGP